MARLMLIDEIHIEVRVPRTISRKRLAAVQRTLRRRSCLPFVRKAFVRALTAHRILSELNIRVSR